MRLENRMSAETSDQIGALAAALAKAQGAMKAALRSEVNPSANSRYADLNAVWEACRGPLAENGLSVVQMPACQWYPDGRAVEVTVTTLLMHSSGQFIRSSLVVPMASVTAWDVGSAISYGRRYALAAVVGVATADDDGSGAQRASQAAPEPVTAGGPAASEATWRLLEAVRTRAGIVTCGGDCPWSRKKYSKRAKGTVETFERCAWHGDLASYSTATGAVVVVETGLSESQARELIAKYQLIAERKERRADDGLDLSPLIATHEALAGQEHYTAPVERALAQSDMPAQELCAHFGVETPRELEAWQVPVALDLIADFGTERFELTLARARERLELTPTKG